MTNPNAAYTVEVPNLPETGSRNTVVLGSAVFSSVTCPITAVVLIDSGTSVAYTGTWIDISSTGTVTVDQN